MKNNKRIELKNITVPCMRFIRDVKLTKNGHRMAEFECECGTVVVRPKSQVINGWTKSCGCRKAITSSINGKRNKKHGHAVPGKRTGAYRSWESMKSRCLNPNDPSYGKYGGSGITVCDRWLSFGSFLNDMGDRPDGHSIDRIDGRKGYFKDNCRWATSSQQQGNKLMRVSVVLNGKQELLTDLSRRYGKSYQLLYDRIFRRNIPVIEALTRAIDERKWTAEVRLRKSFPK